MKYVSTSVVLISLVISVSARANCPSPEAVAHYIADFEAHRPSEGFGPNLTMKDAECARRLLVKALPQVAGPVVGYKAAFMNRDVQQRYALSAPVWGVMFRKMMLESNSKLPAKFGALPLYEADFVVVVKDRALADAKTPLQALEHISAVVPFIELLDVMLEGKPQGVDFIATNSGYRGGVLGPRVVVEATAAFLDLLANMTVVMVEDGTGEELGRTSGSAMSGNPINAAMWLSHALKEAGIELNPNDLLSLGRFLPPAEPKRGTTITVRYLGLPGDPSVKVIFE
jgi:2-keto-4-pentenoate hydratase